MKSNIKQREPYPCPSLPKWVRPFAPPCQCQVYQCHFLGHSSSNSSIQKQLLPASCPRPERRWNRRQHHCPPPSRSGRGRLLYEECEHAALPALAHCYARFRDRDVGLKHRSMLAPAVSSFRRIRGTPESRRRRSPRQCQDHDRSTRRQVAAPSCWCLSTRRIGGALHARQPVLVPRHPPSGAGLFPERLPMRGLVS